MTARVELDALPIIMGDTSIRSLLDGGNVTARLGTKLRVGRKLWVREVWAEINNGPDEYPQIVYRADRATAWHDNHRISSLHYLPSNWEPLDGKWRSLIHIPRWALRLLVEITDVQREQLQDRRMWTISFRRFR